MDDAVNSDGIHANDDQRKGPHAEFKDVHDEIESSQHEEAPPAAVECPGGGPYALDDGAYPRIIEAPSQPQTQEAGDDQQRHFFHARAGALEPTPRDQAENHRSQGRNKAERRIAAAIKDERALAREQVEEPLVEGPGHVTV